MVSPWGRQGRWCQGPGGLGPDRIQVCLGLSRTQVGLGLSCGGGGPLGKGEGRGPWGSWGRVRGLVLGHGGGQAG